MSIKRERRKHERTPEEQARIDAIRKKYQVQKPGPDQLMASGEYEGPVQAGAYWEVRRVMAELKAERERQGLTLADLAERSGLDKGAISKLETGKQVNPTVDTLARIAAGLGLKVSLILQGEGATAEGATTAGQVAFDDPTANLTAAQDALQAALKGTADSERWLGSTFTLQDLIPKFTPEDLLPKGTPDEAATFVKMFLGKLKSWRRLAVAEHLRVAQAEHECMVQDFTKAAWAVYFRQFAKAKGKDEDKADEPRSRRFGRRQD